MKSGQTCHYAHTRVKAKRFDNSQDPALESIMQDVLWIAVTVAFFAVAIAYVHFCERVK